MAGPVTAIHVSQQGEGKTRMPGKRPGKTR